MRLLSVFRKEPTPSELELRITEARAKLDASRARQQELAVEVLYDQKAMVEVAKLREVEAGLSSELELLNHALLALRKREADAEADRLAADKQARVDAWRHAADDALRRLAEHASAFDACLIEAAGHLHGTREAAQMLGSMVHATENESGATFSLELRALTEGPIHRAIRAHLGVPQPLLTTRASDCGLFDQICGGGKNDVTPDSEELATDGADNDDKDAVAETTDAISLDFLGLGASL